ncbi:MAG: glycosyltransferase family 2 protein [Rhodospirillaceae bacterium]
MTDPFDSVSSPVLGPPPVRLDDERRTVATVSAVVVTFWTGSILKECLSALVAEPEIAEIIIVNNGNDRNTEAWLEAFRETDSRVGLVYPGGNLGFAAGCNYGAARATGAFIALVNPDLVLPAGAIARFLEVFRDQPDAWLCGGRLEHPDGTEQRGGRREELTPWRGFVELTRLDRLFSGHPTFRRLHRYQQPAVRQVCEVPTVSGAFMMIPRDLYESLGGMDEAMFMHFEDADICRRVRQGGGRVLYCGHIPLTHHLSTSDVSRVFVEWHKARSMIYYIRKHFAGSTPFPVILAVRVVLWLRWTILVPSLLFRDGPGIMRRIRRH